MRFRTRSAKRENRDVRIEARHARDAVAPETGATDEGPRLDVARGRRHDDPRPEALDRDGARAGPDLAAAAHELAGHRAGHLAVIDDARLRHEERRHGGGVGFPLVELIESDSPYAFEAVGATAALELLEAWHLFGPRRDDHLAAPFEGHALLLAEALE
jgi:hypothetical protein